MSAPLLTLGNVSKSHPRNAGMLSNWATRSSGRPALDRVSLSIGPGEILGLVGESGSGKTTTGRVIAKLTPIDAGAVWFAGQDVTHMAERAFRPLRQHIQTIFQDLDGALNPNMLVRSILAEMVALDPECKGAAPLQARIQMLADSVQLPIGKLDVTPLQLSGGEKRRVGIARALACKPKLVIADELTTALDLPIQAQVANLLLDLREQLGVSFLFISHDLPLVEFVSDRIAVMYAGRIVESGPAAVLAQQPRHPYTRLLWNAHAGSVAKDELTATLAADIAHTGCAFAPRCPVFQAKGGPTRCCAPETEPELRLIEVSHKVACHFPL